ncbi:alpha-N-acetylneuraminide alpha-2,8-sialyltransferase-like [Elgaria multicarinata webbii]|uniref:alpha-N-acetylneuraminide alpha-2,8-sialyltransferase-like n=1 Tax=Elgaria multicarinata webbii TaxID=159646 RepID=UPI002FCD34F6
MVAAQLPPEGASEEAGREKGCGLTPVIRAMPFSLRLGKQKLVQVFCAVFLVSLTLSLLQRTNREQARLQRLAKCRKLSRLLETKHLSESVPFYKTASDEERVLVAKNWTLGRDDRRLLEHLLLMQDCPWEPNPVAVAQYRAELEHCCNASFRLVVTRENAPRKSHIILDGEKGMKLLVNAELTSLLPERSPFSKSQYRRCAVVGNGGILKNSSCGVEIDQADLVIRFNLPPMNFSEDVGTKTSLVTVNPSILYMNFKGLQAQRKPFADALRPYGDALVLIPALSFVGHRNVAYRALYTMEDFGLKQQGFFLNPRYLSTLSDYWKNQGLKPLRLSSGFMFVSMALEFCEHITLYGFWPFPHDLAEQPILHHYYDNVLPKAGVHAMSSEFSHYLGMYAKGVLQLRLGKCQ